MEYVCLSQLFLFKIRWLKRWPRNRCLTSSDIKLCSGFGLGFFFRLYFHCQHDFQPAYLLDGKLVKEQQLITKNISVGRKEKSLFFLKRTKHSLE
uniref:Uncharacterized protein n=1 Tax=Apteryx owenii TaxID=8824 RepID=A0A8B9P4K1_APTOW